MARILTERELDEWVRDTVAFALEWGIAEPLRAALAESLALVRDAVAYSGSALASDLPAPAAGADEAEADTAQRVTADAAVVDAERDTVHGDAVAEHERQSWLRRVQRQD